MPVMKSDMEKARKLGQYMTPQSVAGLMIPLIQRPISTWVVLDPACGDGNLLIAASQAMVRAGVERVQERIIGFDIDPEMVHAAKARLAPIMGCSPDDVRVYAADYLALCSNPLFNSGPYSLSEHNVVFGNPPYGQQREYKFFQIVDQISLPGTEIVYLVPLAFIDRVEGIEVIPLNGRPLGVTTGHAIVRHVAGASYRIGKQRGAQTNSTLFTVETGVKLYERGGGSPAQTDAVVDAKPFSSASPIEGWWPCARTGDISPYAMRLDRLWVNYGVHLAHPKVPERFEGPRLFVRRVPQWTPRRLAACYVEERALCAGDVLVVRHSNNDPELLKGLCVFLNSEAAADAVFARRPSVQLRDSFPKISAKDLNVLLESHVPAPEVLRAMASGYGTSEAEGSNHGALLIEAGFPYAAVSAASSREKSIRHGHISTLQFWWARRPLAACRAALFATLCPPSAVIDKEPELRAALHAIILGSGTTAEKLGEFTGRLSKWESCNDNELLEVARLMVGWGRPEAPLVVDTFAGGGSFPIEALRLGARTGAGDLNPVAAAALRVALEQVPATGDRIVKEYQRVAESLRRKIESEAGPLYGSDTPPLAFFWCWTFPCPNCGADAPLLQNKWLANKTRNVAVRLSSEEGRVDFEVYEPSSAADRVDADTGTISQKSASCWSCKTTWTTTDLQAFALKGKLKERLYAKLTVKGRLRTYTAATQEDQALALEAAGHSDPQWRHREVPDVPFDPNGIRHIWAMSYGIRSTGKLYNGRQGSALLIIANLLELEKERILADEAFTEGERKALVTLLALHLNRVVLYSNRHAWWQSNGEFPANMFGRQAIPMVWNYAEIPVCSPGAGGWASAAVWIAKAVVHLTELPAKGQVWQGDAAHAPLTSGTVDVVALDPPYYDLITYAYLADVFHAWMRPLVGDLYPQDFLSLSSPTEEEAIVDRSHKSSPSPKGDAHFRRKMSDAFQEARRLLKPDGRLLLMYGHKKVKAWSALLGPLLDAGFLPDTSWPLKTERKSKFKHSHVDALASSCLIVCRPASPGERTVVDLQTFEQGLRADLRHAVARLQQSELWGSDLQSALIAPAVSYFAQHSVTGEQGETTLEEFLTDLPKLLGEVEKDMMEMESHFGNVSALAQAAIGGDGGAADLQGGLLLRVALDHAEALAEGDVAKADTLWSGLTEEERRECRDILRMLALSSPEASRVQRTSHASLGRIGRGIV